MKPSKSSKTPLMRFVRQAFQRSMCPLPKADYPERFGTQMRQWNRREFIQTTGKMILLGGLASSIPFSSCRREEDKDVRVVIVGAGMAGLNAAWQLKKSGIQATIYEASNRIGGRMYTTRGFFGLGTVTELGGEFIDSIHEDMLGLAREFSLPLLDTATDKTLTKDAYFFNNRHYTVAQVISELQGIAPRIQADINLYKSNYNQAVEILDKLSLEQYLNNVGATGWIKALLTEAYVTEYGLDAGEQSCLNMIALISLDTSDGTFEIFGESDERYKIFGGNDRLIEALASRLSSQINTDHRLTHLAKSSAGYRLVFEQTGGGTKEVLADFVVLTLPFTLLREVKLDQSLNLPPQKVRAINELGYGTNAKLMLGFNGRPWRVNGYRGYLFTDNGLQTGWENTQLQNTPESSYTVFLGGTSGVNVGSGSPDFQASKYLPLLQQVFPGVQTAYNGRVTRFHWPSSPYAKCSYACYRVGQWKTIAGWEFEPVDRLFFAGEHCSEEFQGYMNGAAETGRRVAEQILEMV
ncbi:MAG: FAD-dependent oxidoreductase [Saprospiraceae bacterium]|nr:FAD-dependent oxidoreductase [Saprospiraceae bacterium]MDW8485133.1 NAD(P)/FAD-dependent oxidoreductase [Saprospiraceae bacterium]